MMKLFLGMFLFFGVHSLSVVAPPLRDRLAAMSEWGWKGIYSLASLAGLVLIALGYAETRLEPTVLYTSPAWLYNLVPVLLLPTFVLIFAPYFPGRISAKIKHPQLVAVKLWAVGHLLVNGTVADVLLFGVFLLWAVAVRVSLKSRVPREVPSAPPSAANDLIVIVLGLGVYALFVFWLHQRWFGVDPLSAL